MSELYQTPAERARALRESTRTGNFFQDTWTDMVSSGISLDEDGSVKRDGAAWWFQRLTPGSDSIAEQKKGLKDSRTIQRAVQESGLTEAQIRAQLGEGNLTVGNVSGTIAEAQRTRADKPTPVQQAAITKAENADARAITAQEDATEIARETLGVTRQNNANQMELTRLQMDQQNKDRGFDRETQIAQNNLSLQLGQMQSDLADKRLQYDRETRSMDKRDRAIAQLMSGLGSLGGAFSL